MSIVMTVITSKRVVGLTMCSYKCPRIELGSALILIVIPGIIFHFAWGIFKTRESTIRNLLDRGCESTLIQGNNFGCF